MRNAIHILADRMPDEFSVVSIQSPIRLEVIREIPNFIRLLTYGPKFAINGIRPQDYMLIGVIW